MPIRKVYSPASMRVHKAPPKKYFVSYCIMDGGLGFGHASLVLSELETNNSNANVRVDGAYGFYSLSKTVVSKVFGFDPVSVGQIKKEDLRYFVMPDTNYVYNFELTEEQMKALKSKLETRMKLYNELIPKAKKIIKSKGLGNKISDKEALEYIKENQLDFPEIENLKPADFKSYHVLKNNCVIQAQAILSDIGLECKDQLEKATQQKFLSKKEEKTRDMKKVNMASIGGTTKSFHQSFSVFSFNPVNLVKNLINKHKGTLPKGKKVEYKKWQTSTKDVESAKEQYLKIEHPALFSVAKKLLNDYKLASIEALPAAINDRNLKSKDKDLNDANELLKIWHAITNDDLIDKKLLHVEAEAFWTQRFEYVDRNGKQRDLWSNVSTHKSKLTEHYGELIRRLQERIKELVPNAKDNEMHISFLDAAYLALSQVDMNYQKIENILENLVDYHDNLLKDELKQNILTAEERHNFEKDLAGIKSHNKKNELTPIQVKKV